MKDKKIKDIELKPITSKEIGDLEIHVMLRVHEISVKKVKNKEGKMEEVYTDTGKEFFKEGKVTTISDMNITFLEFYENVPKLRDRPHLKISFNMFYVYNLDGEKMTSWKTYGLPKDGKQFFEVIQDFKSKLAYSIIKRV